MAEQYIMTSERLSKAYHKREVIKNMTLAFFPGAKIGVIGGNGTGKSTLLRIMAGVDTDYPGTVRHANGIRIGFVPQEPRLTEDRTGRDNIEEAVAPTRALLQRSEELGAKFGDDLPPEEMEKVQAEFDRVQDQIAAA